MPNGPGACVRNLRATRAPRLARIRHLADDRPHFAGPGRGGDTPGGGLGGGGTGPRPAFVLPRSPPLLEELGLAEVTHDPRQQPDAGDLGVVPAIV